MKIGSTLRDINIERRMCFENFEFTSVLINMWASDALPALKSCALMQHYFNGTATALNGCDIALVFKVEP